jgi:MFS family permease
MKRGRVLAVLASAQLLIALDHNIVYVALPEIRAAFGFQDGAEQWVVSAYALGFGGLLLAGGRIADRSGAERVFVAALCIHGAGALAGGAAGSGALLIAARAAQGIGSALLFPATLAILNTTFTGRQRRRALAIWGAAGATGGAFGAFLGGAVAGWLGWRGVLLCVVPVAGAAAAVAVRVLPGGPSPGGHEAWRQAPGALAGTCAAALAILALGQGLNSGWPAAAIAACLVAAALCGAAFWALERRDSMIPADALRSLGAPTVLAFAFMAAFGGQFYLLTVHLQDTLGLSATAAGAAFLPLTVATLAGTQAGGVLLGRAGARGTALAGALMGAAGLAGCGLAIAVGSNAALVFMMALDGVGQGILWSGIWALAGEGAATGQGIANGVVATAQQLGGAAGLALWVTIAQPTASFLIAACLVLAAAAAARADPLVGTRWCLVGRRFERSNHRVTYGTDPGRG